MKKRILTAIITALTAAFLITGCQKADNTAKPAEKKSNTASEVQTETEETDVEDETKDDETENIEDYITNPGIETDGKIDDYLSQFEENLKADGFEVGTRAVKDAASIGAHEGYGININNMPVEVYLFDRNSTDEKSVENIKTAEQSQYITMFGIEINGETPKTNCVINNDLVLIFPAEDIIPNAYKDKDKIIDAFMQIQ